MVHLPTLNAALNGCAAGFLLAGYVAVKRRAVRLHQWFMAGALASSALFLTSYLYYHYTAGAVTRYEGAGFMRALYFAILLTHTPLAALMAPAILLAVWYAWRRRYDRHTQITRWLWPVWMYVSVTGVAIYLMLYVLPQ